MKNLFRLLYALSLLLIVITLIGFLPLGPGGLPIGCQMPVLHGFYTCTVQSMLSIELTPEATSELTVTSPPATSEE